MAGIIENLILSSFPFLRAEHYHANAISRIAANMEKKIYMHRKIRIASTYNIKEVSFFATCTRCLRNILDTEVREYHPHPVHTFRKCVSCMRHAYLLSPAILP